MPKRENNDEANVLNGYSAFLRNKCNCNNSKLQKGNVQQKKQKKRVEFFFANLGSHPSNKTWLWQ